ncbi:MAG: hypothetical protein K9K93_02065 [Acholeplasmataceae bacterium]|nr:hypothetical protein [Acholeplasmataceae bacterium]
MFKRVLIHELKSILRDRMYVFFAAYPAILGVVGYFLVSYLNDQGHAMASQIVVLLLILMTGFVYGAITGFTLLDDQDDMVIASLKITPISVRTYIRLKLLMSYVFAMAATLLLMVLTGFLKGSDVSLYLMIMLLSSLQAPIIALLINSFARNKVEGFVVMKTTGILLMVPIASLFLTDWKEVFLALIPGFWPARLVTTYLLPATNLFLGSTVMYFFVGMVFNGFVIYGLFAQYTKRISV